MGPAMLVATIHAGALAAAAAGDAHALPHSPPLIATLPMDAAAWPMHRCGDSVPGRDEATATAAIDAACVRLVVHDQAVDRGRGARRAIGGGGGGFDGGDTWRVAQLVLPGLEGLVGPGGMGLGIGSELQLVRGAHMTVHLAAPRDTRIAETQFAPETTVLARCGACWTESEAVGAGLVNGASGRRSPLAIASR